ncbi:MAG: nucleotide sugar dehydrogenase [Candidatus Bathyarchaeota archaeon]|nr:nucleotide sugar dehydrogenase [Candidatus Bathyarchaeota archaeon]
MKFASEDIETPGEREKHTVTVVGCGRVGLPTACLFVEAGFKVIGVDSNRHIVSLLKKRKSPFSEPQLHAFIGRKIRSNRFSVTTDARSASSASEVVVINVHTPIDKKNRPDFSNVERVCREVGMGLRSGSLVVFQSIMGLGMTETLAKEALENASGLRAGRDFGLVYCPIRAASEHVLEDMTTRTRVVGAINQQSLEAACLLLGTITKGEIVPARDIMTLEAAKLFEEAYLDVNSALANEFAHFCEKAKIDFMETQKAFNPEPNYCRQVLGITEVNGPKDSYLLLEEAEAVNARLRMLTLARRINGETLNHTLQLVRDAFRTCQKTLRRAKISIFGVSSCPNMKELHPRSSIERLVISLKKRGAKVQVYDPFFSPKELSLMGYLAKATLTKTIEGTDCIIITVGHDRFKRMNLGRISAFVKKPAAIVDMGNVVDPAKAEKEGFVYRGLGRGVWTK